MTNVKKAPIAKEQATTKQMRAELQEQKALVLKLKKRLAKYEAFAKEVIVTSNQVAAKCSNEIEALKARQVHAAQ